MRFPDIRYAKKAIGYNAKTGEFCRLLRIHGARVGESPSRPHPEGYCCVTIDYRTVKSHVLAMALVHGGWPTDTQSVIHKDGDRANNRLANLELVDRCPSYKASDLFTYDPGTGSFKWRYKAAKNGKPLSGDPGWTNADGYPMLSAGSRQVLAHRVAHILMTGSDVPKGFEIDHINRVVNDNRWCNLRVVRRSQNNMNTKIRVDNKSGVKGVYFDKSRNNWAAEIKANGKRKHLGRFDTLQEAAKARKEAEQRFHGEYSPRIIK